MFVLFPETALAGGKLARARATFCASVWALTAVVAACGSDAAGTKRSSQTDFVPAAPPPGGDGFEPLYEGTREAPIAGVQLGERPVVYYRASSDSHGAPAGAVSVADDVRVSFSKDWRQVVRAQVGRTSTRYSFQGEERELPGQVEFLVPSRGATLLASVVEPRDPEMRSFWIAPGEPLQREPQPVSWLALAADGSRFAVGSEAGVTVLDPRGNALARLPAAELGALSGDGEWIALERGGAPEEPESARRVEVYRVGDEEPRTVRVSGRALELEFSPRGDRLARVSRSELHLIAMRVEPAGVDVHPAPAGFEWRSVAFGPEDRIAAGSLRVERRPKRERRGSGELLEGSARVAVDLLTPERPSARVERELTLWNHSTPELAFDERGRLFAIVWPSAFEVVFP